MLNHDMSKILLAYELAICSTVLWLLSYCVSGTWMGLRAVQDFNYTIWKCNNACLWNAGYVWATPTYRNCLPARPHDLEHKFHRPLLFATNGQAALCCLGNHTYWPYPTLLIASMQLCTVHTRAETNSLKLRSDSLYSDTTLSLQSFITMVTSMLN